MSTSNPTEYGPYQVHPFVDLFPLMEGEDFDQLVADIKLNGLREPITLSADRETLIDGRNRYRACAAAGLDPVFEALPAAYTELQILDLIVSSNMSRRHLNPGQRAVLALDYERFYAEEMERAENQRKATQAREGGRFVAQRDAAPTVADLPPSTNVCHCGNDSVGHTHATPRREKSRDKAAKTTGASGRGVQQAKAVKRDAPDLYAQVRTGELASTPPTGNGGHPR